jgi:hypothetical protein
MLITFYSILSNLNNMKLLHFHGIVFNIVKYVTVVQLLYSIIKVLENI